MDDKKLNDWKRTAMWFGIAYAFTFLPRPIKWIIIAIIVILFIYANTVYEY